MQVMSVCICVQDVTASMDEGLAKVNYVCDQAEKILPNTSVEGKKLIEQQVTELTNDWVCCFLLPSLFLLWESVSARTNTFLGTGLPWFPQASPEIVNAVFPIPFPPPPPQK